MSPWLCTLWACCGGSTWAAQHEWCSLAAGPTLRAPSGALGRLESVDCVAGGAMTFAIGHTAQLSFACNRFYCASLLPA
eukprot:780520-Lingulodinium_polyedra.AAC.1